MSLTYALDQVRVLQGKESSSQGLSDGVNASLESFQTMYLLGCMSTFYVDLDECRKFRKQYAHIIELVRNSGLFSALPNSGENDLDKSWEDWIYEEKRRRIAFKIYLLDCGHVLFFGNRPRVAAYEVRHRIPAHEHVYEARTAVEWRIVYTATSQVEYPVLLEMLLSPHVEAPPTDISIMGHFLLLHGAFTTFFAYYRPARSDMDVSADQACVG